MRRMRRRPSCSGGERQKRRTAPRLKTWESEHTGRTHASEVCDDVSDVRAMEDLLDLDLG